MTDEEGNQTLLQPSLATWKQKWKWDTGERSTLLSLVKACGNVILDADKKRNLRSQDRDIGAFPLMLLVSV